MARICKDWLRSYLTYTSLSESPEIFHLWTGVGTIAAVLKRRVWIDMDIFQWTPNFYIIFVAPAGVVSKSTTIDIGMDLLADIDGVTWGPPSCTWQALGRRLELAQEQVPLEPGNLMGEMEAMACVTCPVSELGTFLDFQDNKLMSVLTDLWDGKRSTFEHATVTQGNIKIKNPWLNIIAATTPAWLKQNAPETMIGGGFASRVIWVYADKKRHLVPYPGLIRDRNDKHNEREALTHDLREMSMLLGEIQMSPDAIQIGSDWYTKHWDERPIHMASDRFGGYIARKQSHIHKLAIVLSLSRHDSLWIEEKDLQDALKITTAMESSMINVFESVGVAPLSRLLMEIVTFINTYQDREIAVSRQMLWRHCMQIMSGQEFADVCKAGVEAGYLRIVQSDGEFYYKLLVKISDIKEKAPQTGTV